MKAIYKKRMMRLHALLLADAKNKKGVKFDLGCLAKTGEFDEITGNYIPPTVSCNTNACAMGLAAISGLFQREGIRWRQCGSDIRISLKQGRKTIEGWEDAAMHLFGLHRYEVRWLFTTDAYYRDNLPSTGATGERAVARRIKAFVDGRKFAPLKDPEDNLIDAGRFIPAHA